MYILYVLCKIVLIVLIKLQVNLTLLYNIKTHYTLTY